LSELIYARSLKDELAALQLKVVRADEAINALHKELKKIQQEKTMLEKQFTYKIRNNWETEQNKEENWSQVIEYYGQIIEHWDKRLNN
jgi:predicted  nucleic acid-binding Zn-ribbon protein